MRSRVCCPMRRPDAPRTGLHQIAEDHLTTQRWLLVGWISALALFLARSPARAADADSPLAGVDPTQRIAAAAKLKKTDAGALARALDALSASEANDADRDFLALYALQERDRALRFVAFRSLSFLDRKAAAAWFKAKATNKDEKDLVTRVVSIEAVGLLGSSEDAPAVLELIKSEDEFVSIQAINAAVHLCTEKDVDALIESGLADNTAHAQHIADHTAWAVQDLLGRPELAIALFEKVSGKKGDPNSGKAATTVAMLREGLDKRFLWRPSVVTLALARNLVLSAPNSIEVTADDDDHKNACLAALAWLKDHMPGAELLVRAAANRIVVGDVGLRASNPKQETIQISVENAGEPAHKMAFRLFTAATLLWQKRVGEPFTSHRGEEPMQFDAYDLCVIARLYNCAPGGISRQRFIQSMQPPR
jgi:hypothetical protein